MELAARPRNGPADDWDPAGVRDQYEKTAPGNPVYRIALKMGKADQEATGRAAGIDTGSSPAVSVTVRTGGPGVQLSAALLPIDATDQTITWSTKSNLAALSQTTGPEIEVTGTNTTEEAEYVPINATASDGFYVTAYVYVEPKFIDPPKVASAPKLDPPADGKVQRRVWA